MYLYETPLDEIKIDHSSDCTMLQPRSVEFWWKVSFSIGRSIYRKTNHALISEIPRGLVRPMTTIGRRREQRKYDIPRVSRYHRTVCKQLFSFFRLLSISGIPGQVRVLSIAVLWTSFPVKLNFSRSPRMIFISLPLSFSFSLLLVQLHGKEIESSGIVFSLKVKRTRGERV